MPRSNPQLPKELFLPSGQEVRLYAFDDLESLGRAALKQRALNLRDKLGKDLSLPRLQLSGSADQTVLWLLEVQCLLAGAVGMELSAQDFGAPAGVFLTVSSGAIGIAGGGSEADREAWGPGGPDPDRPGTGRGGGTPARAQVDRSQVSTPHPHDPTRITPRSQVPAHAMQHSDADRGAWGPSGPGPDRGGGTPAMAQVDRSRVSTPHPHDPTRITPRSQVPAHAYAQHSYAPPGTPGAPRPDQAADAEAAATRRRAQGSASLWC